jgi:thiosulfate/3-mercaptopyruvate sulfurtransferase
VQEFHFRPSENGGRKKQEVHMKKIKILLLIATISLVLPFSALAREIAPVVSTDWLEKNLDNTKVVLVDIRKVEEYKEGHVPNSISVFYGTWAIKKNGLDNELPEDDDLFDIIGSSGIKVDSHVVVIGKTDTIVDRVNQARIAYTLKYAGLENIAILDGAFNKWVKDKKPVSTDMVRPKPVEYQGKVNKDLFATKDYVLGRIGNVMILDARMPDFFFGVSKLPIVEKAGHIQGAVNLPACWIFTDEGTFRTKEELEATAAGVLGKDKSKEIIVYCDTGRLCKGRWFVLREILEYKNVKSYDGSMQEWGKDPGTPVGMYKWY